MQRNGKREVLVVCAAEGKMNGRDREPEREGELEIEREIVSSIIQMAVHGGRVPGGSHHADGQPDEVVAEIYL